MYISAYRPNSSFFGGGNSDLLCPFPTIFAEFVQSTSFYALLLLLQRFDMFKIAIQIFQL